MNRRYTPAPILLTALLLMAGCASLPHTLVLDSGNAVELRS